MVLAPTAERTARFVCCLILVSPDKVPYIFEGCCEGIITPVACGAYGFGYDPLFLPLGHQKTFAELGHFQKNGISHRARAMNKLRLWLKEGMEGHKSA